MTDAPPAPAIVPATPAPAVSTPAPAAPVVTANSDGHGATGKADRPSIQDDLNSVLGTKPEPKEPAPVKEPEVKTEPTPAAEPKKPEPEAQEPKTNAELRKAYEKVKAERAAFENEITTLRKKPAEPDPEIPKLRETVAQREKRIAEYEQQMRYTNYEKSEEYQEKFEKPKQKLLRDATDTIEELVRVQADGTERAGTYKDFQDILLMEPLEAAKTAKEWFGDAAPEVLAFRREYRKLSSERASTMEKYQKEAVELEQQRIAKQQEHAAGIQKLWGESNEKYVKDFPKLFAPIDGDEEGNDLLAEGYEKADRAFLQVQNANPHELVKLHAEARNKFAGFDRLVKLKERVEAELVEEKKKNAAFEKSIPGAGQGAEKIMNGRTTIEEDLKWAASQKRI